jgi:hypothetical protein
MTKDWTAIYQNLPDGEKDKIAILRVMECSNGVIQHAFRDKIDWALSIDDTRRAMQFSMSCMKKLEIPLKDETIAFAPETQVLLREARQLYVDGVKKGNDESLSEFMKVSRATVRGVGLTRIFSAAKTLKQNIDDIPPEAITWGVSYIMQFFDKEEIEMHLP